MKRRIITIDENKCNGCGACAKACHEGAIDMVNGKARLMREDYCDGLGDCLPACPADAITFEEREALAYNEAAVLAAKAKKGASTGLQNASVTIPSLSLQAVSATDQNESMLSNWPVQIKLAPPTAPYFDGADLLIAADCTAFAYASLHRDFIQGHVTLIGCPKLDAVDYSQKLAEIFRNNNIKSIHVLRMTVPCCGGLTMAVKKAIFVSGKNLPLQVTTISNDGKIQ
ncbi:MAG: 4Fe-4S binding protein [Lachnospiraceae bacterium]|nr:4Fe-4S binding protein [Lachnospiraceae bacterium]